MRGDWKLIIKLSIVFLILTYPLWLKLFSGLETFANQTTFKDVLIAAVGSLAGALGGAWIAESSLRNRLLLEELKNVNAAIMVTFGISNSLLNLKAQHVKGMRENFNDQLSALEANKREQFEAGRVIVFEFVADLRTLSPVNFANDSLEKLLIEKISLNGRPLTLINVLTQTLNGLNDSIKGRNNVIEQFKASGWSADVIARHYFGLPNENGSVDVTYPSLLDAINSHVNDSIFFSQLLCKDLVKYGKRLKERIGEEAPSINQPHFEDINPELQPDENDYRDWINNFK